MTWPTIRIGRIGRAVWTAWLLSVMVAVLPACNLFEENRAEDESAAGPTPTPRQVVPPSSRAPKRTYQYAAAPPEMVAAVDELLAEEDGVYGVVLMRPDGALLYSQGCETPFVAASLYKLVLLADVYAAREAGDLTFVQQLTLRPEYFPTAEEPADSYFDLSAKGGSVTVEEAVFATGAYSSNVAARSLIDLTGRDSIEAMAGDLGLTHTHFLVVPTDLPEWPPQPTADTSLHDAEAAMVFANAEARTGPVNLTSPCDMARFFQMLLVGEVVSPEASAELLTILRQQVVNDRFPILLPPETEMAHKTGNLEHVVHDVGVIYGQDGPVILAALSEGMADDERARQVIQRLALVAYGEYNLPPVEAVVE
ncbi:MAG: serine hydrolase [Thermomicrobiales bacterium]